MSENEDLARDEAFVKLTLMQRQAGADVRVPDYQLIPQWLQTMTADFIVFDGAVSYETTAAPAFHAGTSRPVIVRTVLAPMSAKAGDLESNPGQSLSVMPGTGEGCSLLTVAASAAWTLGRARTTAPEHTLSRHAAIRERPPQAVTPDRRVSMSALCGK